MKTPLTLFMDIMTYLRVFLIALFSLLLLTSAFAGGYFVHAQLNPTPSFPLANEAYGFLTENGINPLPPAPALEYGMIHGMVSAFQDPYTVFVEPVQHELQSDALSGSFGGIGAQLGRDAQGFHVLFPYPDSPASKSGILEGDRLNAVDGAAVNQDTPVEDIQSMIRGPVGQKTYIKIARPPDYHEIIFPVERTEIPIPSVTWRLDTSDPEIGIIKINLIAASTPDEVTRALQELQNRDATRFVLDLRDNPGGLLTAGVDIARLFLESGIVMQQEYRDHKTDTYKVESPGPFSKIPLVVLINQNSASAAEITAGALQGLQRAKLIGMPSYGKDSVQFVFVLSDNSSLHITAARWWIPALGSGHEDASLQPDILIDPSADSNIDLILLAAVEALQVP